MSMIDCLFLTLWVLFTLFFFHVSWKFGRSKGDSRLVAGIASVTVAILWPAFLIGDVVNYVYRRIF